MVFLWQPSSASAVRPLNRSRLQTSRHPAAIESPQRLISIPKRKLVFPVNRLRIGDVTNHWGFNVQTAEKQQRLTTRVIVYLHGTLCRRTRRIRLS